jgi:hypothetical protein
LRKVFTSKSGNTFLNIGATYPNQTFTGWISPASPVSKSPMLAGIEGKRVRITGRIELYKGKPGPLLSNFSCPTPVVADEIRITGKPDGFT